MNALAVGLIVFALLFGGSLFGLFLGWILPDQHRTPEARDVIRIVMAMLATLTAVVLGLLTGAAINSLGEKEGELRSAGVQFIMLDRTLAAYGPETEAMRATLKSVLAQRISQIWPEESDGDVALTALKSGPGIELVRDELFTLTPVTDEQRWLHAHALNFVNAIAISRWTTIEQVGSRFPWPFFVVVIVWLTIIFASFGLFAPRNLSVVVAMFIASFGLAGAIFMIVEMDQPYGGLAKIPSTPLRIALEQLGKA
jgi:hypothetical protein